MGVPVHFKPGHRWLRSTKKPSVLGGGLLERARSTTLALLGATTAVGLAMVALALNQSWPLIPGSPLPVTPLRHEAVGKATVAAAAIANLPQFSSARAGGSPGPGSSRSDRGGRSPAPAGGSAPTASAELVVAPSAPAEPQGDAPHGTGNPTPSPFPVGEAPQAPATPVPASAPTPPEPTPQSPPAVEPAPPASSAEAPVDSSDDEWDDDDDWDDGSDWDDDDDWRDHDRGHGYGRSHGHHDD